MKQLKCETCGSTLELSGDGLHAQCPMCGNIYEYRSPKEEMAVQQMNEANDLRINMNFDDAIKKYRLVTKNNPEDAEGYWGLLLSKYGIAYEYEPDTKKYVPTFHRNRRGNILEDVNAQNALKYASDAQKVKYETALNELRYIQEGIENFADNCDPYDVFISFKATEIGGEAKTIDRDIAYNIYDELNSRGIRTFFSEVSLRSMVAEDYEAIIFSALNTCRVFILVGTSKDNIDSLWVKNEWTRYSERVADDRLNGLPASSRFAVIGGDLKPSELPREFARTQNVMLSNYAGDSYKKDVAYSVEKLLGIEKKEKEVKPAIDEKNVAAMVDKLVKERVSTQAPGSEEEAKIAPLLTRMNMFLGDKEFEEAKKYANRVLDISPKCGEAYLGNLLADLELSDRKSLGKRITPFVTNKNYVKILQYGDEALKDEVKGYAAKVEENINNRIKDAKLAKAKTNYNMAVKQDSITMILNAYNELLAMGDWKDARKVADECENVLNNIYDSIDRLIEDGDPNEAYNVCQELGRFHDADKDLPKCQEAIHQKEYDDAVALMNSEKFIEAKAAFKALGSFGDSEAKIKECRELDKKMRYLKAVNDMHSGNYKRAIGQFKALGRYEDAESKVDECELLYQQSVYDVAKAYYDNKKYDAASDTLSAVTRVPEAVELKKKVTKAIKKQHRRNNLQYSISSFILMLGKILLITGPIIALVVFLVYHFTISHVKIDGVKYSLYQGEYYVESIVGGPDDITVLDEVKGKKVSFISPDAYNGINGIYVHKLTIKAPIKELPEKAFAGERIEIVELPNTVVEIGNECFERSTLRQITGLDNVEKIGYDAFRYTWLKSIDLGNKLRTVSNSAFSDCVSLETVTIPETTTRIDNGAFFKTESLNTVNGIENVKEIGKIAFTYSGIQSANLTNIETIGEQAFQESGLTKLILGSNIKEIPYRAFYQCKSMKELQFSEGIETVREQAFSQCSSVEKLIIPDSMKRIEELGFYNFAGAKTIYIPATVETVQRAAFDTQTGKRRITVLCQATKKPSGWNNYWLDDDDKIEWGAKKPA